MNWTVRKLAPDDAAEVREARLEALRLHPEAFSRDYEHDAALPPEEWRARLARNFWVGGFMEGTLQGMAVFMVGDSPKTAHSGHVGGMYVRATARGTGMAGAIIEALLDHATDKVEQVQLTVNAENARAIRLYERRGFRTVGRIPRSLRIDKRYYDELIMVRPLSSSD